MTTVRRIGWLAVAAVVAAGCRAPEPLPPQPAPTVPLPPPDLPAVAATPIVPDFRLLPSVDPTVAGPDDVAPPPAGYRGLTADVCRKEAAARASVAGLFDRENRIPPPRVNPRNFHPAADALTREVREHLAAEGRNRAAADALDEYYQLADAEGRGGVLRMTLPVLDRLRATVRKARAEGVRVPVDPDELDRQRASLLGLVGQADLAARAVDIDLKRRLGIPGRAPDRLRPVGEFGVSAGPIDAEAAVRTALECRPDLLALRATYLQLSPDTLPVVRDILRTQIGQAGAGLALGPVERAVARPLLAVLLARYQSRQLDAQVAAELAVRRQQLYDMIAERERQAADEVRAAAANLAAQGGQVGLARWRAEQLMKKADEVKGQGPLVELPAELEACRARSEVVAAVMTWHRARAKLLAAQGLLGNDGGPQPQPEVARPRWTPPGPV